MTLNKKTVTEQVYDVLKDRILSSAIEPGTRLKELEITRQLGVSSSPVREAMQQLEKEGWLINKPRRGRFVRSVDLEEMIEVYQIRELLEGFAARKAVSRISPDQVNVMEKALDRMIRAVKNKNWQEVTAADVKFHRTVFEAAGNNTNLELYDQLVVKARMFTHVPELNGDNIEITGDKMKKEHAELIKALTDGVPEKAERTFRNSIRKSIHKYGSFLKKGTVEGR